MVAVLCVGALANVANPASASVETVDVLAGNMYVNQGVANVGETQLMHKLCLELPPEMVVHSGVFVLDGTLPPPSGGARQVTYELAAFQVPPSGPLVELGSAQQAYAYDETPQLQQARWPSDGPSALSPLALAVPALPDGHRVLLRQEVTVVDPPASPGGDATVNGLPLTITAAKFSLIDTRDCNNDEDGEPCQGCVPDCIGWQEYEVQLAQVGTIVQRLTPDPGVEWPPQPYWKDCIHPPVPPNPPTPPTVGIPSANTGGCTPPYQTRGNNACTAIVLRGYIGTCSQEAWNHQQWCTKWGSMGATGQSPQCDAMGCLAHFLSFMGYPSVVKLDYYGALCDATAHADGEGKTPGAHLTTFGHTTVTGCNGGTNTHMADTPIEDLAYHVAWYIYNHHTKNNEVVDVVAHSMGGLVIRHALLKVAEQDPSFPPRLLVEDVVTIASPHHGADKQFCYANVFCGSACGAYNGAWYSTWVSWEAKQTCYQSAFMKKLIQDGQMVNGPAEWSCIAADQDEVVGFHTATALDACNGYVYWWNNPTGVYTHGAYMKDQSMAYDRDVKYGCGPYANVVNYSSSFSYPNRRANGAHADYLVLQALATKHDTACTQNGQW